MGRFFALLVVLGIIGAGLLAWASTAWDTPGPAARSGGETIVLIPPGTRLTGIAQKLEKAQVVRIPLLFVFNLGLHQMHDKVKAGEYAIPSRASMADIAALLVSGKSLQHKLTAAEGLTSDMIWKLVVSDKVLTGEAGPVPEEGTLLPETYLFVRGTTRAELLDRMRKAQEKFLAAHWSGRADALPFQSMRDALILASVVEKETALPQERAHIASVFVNRLKVGMRLQSDPTIIYGITKGYPLGRGIRESEIQSDTPYNTYVISGLPAGPICNPGKDSIAAVLNPDKTDDLFFVATGRGGHVFAATMSEHARNVMAWRAAERLKAQMPDPAASVPLPALPTARRGHRHA